MMKIHEPDPGRFEAIEAFLLGKMSAEERAAFVASMERDGGLHKEVDVQRDAIRSVELAGFTRTLQAVAAKEAPVPSTSTGWKTVLKYAAMVALLLAGALWWMARPDTHERLYAEYHVADPGLPVPMSITKAPVFHDAMVAFKMEDYAEARAKWAPLLRSDPSNDTLRYYIASALLEMDSTAQAIPLLETVAKDSASQFSRKAQWYLFLTYVRTGRTDLLGTIHLDGDSTYGVRVQAIKAELDK